eukprot:m.428806 g.428806  ORF g.428806 m.428806 type:complete len:494 (-) comp20233_c0_seq31:3751-5232(-)
MAASSDRSDDMKARETVSDGEEDAVPTACEGLPSEVPVAFRRWLAANQIDEGIYRATLPHRYLRTRRPLHGTKRTRPAAGDDKTDDDSAEQTALAATSKTEHDHRKQPHKRARVAVTESCSSKPSEEDAAGVTGVVCKSPDSKALPVLDGVGEGSDTLSALEPHAPCPTDRLDAKALSSMLHCSVTPVAWLPQHLGFYQLPATASFASTTLYKQGYLHGMDASSGAAVAALDIQPGDDCLDLCCAPGAKLALMADLAGEQGSVTGVDVSARRMATCRSTCRRLKVTGTRVYLADGTTFDEPPPASPCPTTVHHPGGFTKRERKAMHKLPSRDPGPTDPPRLTHASRKFQPGKPGAKYNKVLVDAECTHDGSIKHVLKYNTWGWDTFEARVMDAERMASLQTLQRGLLENGFRLLAPGGSLVYSTCSLTLAQNEEVLSWFLEQHSDAALVPAGLEAANPGHPDATKYPHLQAAAKFDPVTTGTSGLFVAKMTKL